MYRFIDTVSIDVMSITRYHPGREPREERSVDRSEAREVWPKRREPDSGGLRRFAGKDIFRSLTLIATVLPVGYSSGDARHQISTERRERQLRTFRRSWNYAPLDLRSPHRGRFLFGQAGRHASFVSTYRTCVRVCRGDVLRIQGAPEIGRLMGDHWRLAFRCAGWIFALMVPVGALLLYVYGVAHAEAFAYGVGIGLVSLLSTALTVSLLWGPNMAVGVMVGVFSFVGRCLLAAGALGVPAYLGLWPVLPMLGGFAGVYLVENIVLMPKALKISHDELREKILHTFEAARHAWHLPLHIGPVDISINKSIWFLWIGAAVTFSILFVGSRLLKDRPGAYQVIVEEVYGFGRKQLAGQMGKEGMKFLPYTLSLFVFILVLNLIGLIPNSYPVTSSISFTLVLAIFTLLIYNYVGIRRNGLGTYLKSFVPSGMPAKPIMAPFMFFVEALQQFVTQPLTLGMRLYANILAGHLIIFVFLGLILYLGTFVAIVSVPLALAFYAFEIFVAVIQAHIFPILTQGYI